MKYFQIRATSTNVRFSLFGQSLNVVADYDTTLSTGTWYMVTATYDGTTSRIYLNAVEGNVAGTGSLAPVSVGDSEFRTAQEAFGSQLNSTRHDGWLGPMAMWSKTLSQTDITELYNSGDFLYLPETTGGTEYLATDRQMVFIDSDATDWTIKFPVDPVNDSRVSIVNTSMTGHNPIVIDGNGKDIEHPGWGPTPMSWGQLVMPQGTHHFVFNSGRDNWYPMNDVVNPMTFQGDWVADRVYPLSSVVKDYGWTCVSVKQTSERAAPEESVSAWFSDLGAGPPTFTTQTNSATYITGTRVTFSDYVRISGYRVWLPESTGSFEYEVWATREESNVPNSSKTEQLIATFVPTSTGWREVVAQSFFYPGSVLDMALVSRSVSQPSTFSGTWQTLNENSSPSDGEAVFRNNGTEVWVHNSDDGGTNRESTLATIAVGATMECGGLTWTVAAISTDGSGATGRHQFTLSPSQGRPAEATQTLEWNWGSTAAVSYVEDTSYWAGVSAVEGFETATYPPTVFNDTFYGVDFFGAQIIPREDWEVLVASQTGIGVAGASSPVLE